MKRWILVGLIILMGIVMVAILTTLFLFQNTSKSHYPKGDPCQIDADCVCTLECPDCCGEVGESWKCIENVCKLGVY